MRSRHPGLVTGLVCVLLLLAQVGVQAGARPAAAVPPVRILLVGDSMTQGSAGDWTWRHRLWQHFAALGTSVDFVGPHEDLYDNVNEVHGSTDYVDPGFDRDHASRWGMTFAFPDQPVGELIELYQPDVVVEMLGVNDLVYLGLLPEAVAQELSDFVHDARAADPEVDLVVAQATQTWFAGVPELNQRISDLAGDLDAEQSRVVVAYTDVGYQRVQDTWDGSHANSWGELKIAAAVADSLAVLGVGAPATRPLPEVPRGPRLASRLSAFAGDGAVALSWTASPGATRTQVSMIDRTSGGDWFVVATVPGTALLVDGLPNRHLLEFRVLPAKGAWTAAPDVTSNTVSARPRPALPGRVKHVETAALRHGIRVSWDPARRADSYRVWLRKLGARDGWSTRSVHSTRVRIGDLEAGARYQVAVQPVGRGEVGERSSAQSVVPLGPTPGAPDVKVSIDRSGAAHVTWQRVRHATRYVVQWRRAHSRRWHRVHPAAVVGTAALVAGLRAGKGYEFRVRADHMRVRGSFSAPVRARVPVRVRR